VQKRNSRVKKIRQEKKNISSECTIYRRREGKNQQHKKRGMDDTPEKERGVARGGGQGQGSRWMPPTTMEKENKDRESALKESEKTTNTKKSPLP